MSDDTTVVNASQPSAVSVQTFIDRCIQHCTYFEHWLRYDCAAAEYGKELAEDVRPLSSKGIPVPVFATDEARKAVRKQIQWILANHCIMQMVTRFETTAWRFLSARKSCEFFHSNGRKPTQEEWLPLMAKPRKLQLHELCLTEVVAAPSKTVKDFGQWLQSIIKIRNCLAHRCGRVEYEDILGRNPKWSQVVALGPQPKLNATWMTLEFVIDGVKLKTFPEKGGAHLDRLVMEMGTAVRSWPLNGTLAFTSEDCAQMATTISAVCHRLCDELCLELQELGIPVSQRKPKPEVMVIPEIYLEWEVPGPDGKPEKKSGKFRHSKAEWVDAPPDPHRAGLPKSLFERFKDLDTELQ